MRYGLNFDGSHCRTRQGITRYALRIHLDDYCVLSASMLGMFFYFILLELICLLFINFVRVRSARFGLPMDGHSSGESWIMQVSAVELYKEGSQQSPQNLILSHLHPLTPILISL